MKTMQSNIAWSMGKARRSSLGEKAGRIHPGPGQYKPGNQETIKVAQPKWSILGKGVKEKYEKHVPGPGAYNDNSKKHNAPNYSFGTKLSKTFYKEGDDVPGPGQYASPSTMGRKGGYLAGKVKARRKDDNPGPGSYSMRSTFEAKGIGFGSGKKSSPNLNKTAYIPGPGSYQPPSDFGNKTHGFGFGNSKRSKKNGRHQMPGPGQYTVNENFFRDTKAATIKGRPHTTKPDNKPGPGHYQSKSLHASPAFSMGIGKKVPGIRDNQVPAPNTYNPDFGKVKQGTPGVSFGSPSKEGMKGDDKMPGPGQYEVRTKTGADQPSFGIRGRYSDRKEDMKPGPGNYEPKDEFTRKGPPGTKMGSGPKSFVNTATNLKNPGPGNYDVSKGLNTGKEFSFGSGRRKNSEERRYKDMPGPGQYKPHDYMGSSQGFTIKGKIIEKPKELAPGPGQYNPPAPRNAPSYSLSGHRTEDPIMNEKKRMPPPNSYNPDDGYVKSRAPTVSFGNRPKTSDIKPNNEPGPGQYQVGSTLQNKGIYMGTRSPQKVIERSPGPGVYNPNNNVKYKSGPAFSIGGVKGDAKIPGSDMPGPGTYNSPERPTTGYHFGSEKRQDLGGRGDSPGPGQYRVPDTLGKSGKSIIITGRYDTKKDVNEVGPGQYKHPTTLGGPKFSMGAGEKGTKLNKNSLMNPAPGTYDVSSHLDKPNGPGVRFGSSERDKIKKAEGPGPGDYALPSTLGGKGVTIQGKIPTKVEDRAPGPGAYGDVKDPSKKHGGSVSFGQGGKSSGPKVDDNPGPGMYKVDLPYKGGAVFGKDKRDKVEKGDMPGPGQYNTRAQEGLTYF